jgi:Afadin- and alpha -actinin-Binding
MDSNNLDSASTYLNNLLLARGLLRNGKAIDFAHPDRASGGSEATTAKIINLVHDMVLRRDREAEQRENLATNLRILRAEESQRVLEVERVQNRNVELTRNMSAMEAQERAFKANMRKAEAQVRELKEQMLKMKSTLDQVRAKCISDVRKRDIELEKLKAHLTGLQRGRRETSGMKVNTLNLQPAMIGAREMRGGQDVNSADWSLEKETNDFLAALVNETSTENVSLRNIVGDAMVELKHLTGLDLDQQQQESQLDEDDGIGIPGQYRKSRQKDEAAQQDVLVPCDTLAAEMDAVLEHCRAILKDPSFVSIEEVQIRDAEIIKLREGWEKMASKWKEAVLMMDTWRRRMLDGGDSDNLSDLSHIGLTKSMAVFPNGDAVIGRDEDLSNALFDDNKGGDLEYREDEPTEERLFDRGSRNKVSFNSASDESEPEIPSEPSPKHLATSPARRGLKLPRPAAALGETTGNVKLFPNEPTRSTSFTDSADSGIGSLDGSVEADIDDVSLNHPVKPPSRIPRQVSSQCDIQILNMPNSDQAKKENVPPMTVFEKLAAVEAEAKEAEEAKQWEERPHKRKASKPLIRGKARRKSTLSPEELANLMGVR